MCSDNSCTGSASRRRVILGAVAAVASHPDVRGQELTALPPTRVLDDPAIVHGRVDFLHNGVPAIDGCLARPKAAGRYPAVLVIAGNKISEEYIPNTCAALALAGFVGLAPNVFHPLPDTATNPEYDKYLGKHTEWDRLDDIQAGVSFLRIQDFVRPGSMGIEGAKPFSSPLARAILPQWRHFIRPRCKKQRSRA